jgi:hypothetical protein
MKNNIETKRDMLRGRSILLLASIPTREEKELYPTHKDAHIEIDEAIISLARAVFSQKGRIFFNGSLSQILLLALVAGEYREPVLAETLRSEIEFQEEPPSPITILGDVESLRKRREIELLENLGFLSMKSADREIFEFTNIDAVVCVGGGKFVEEGFRHFEGKIPIFVISSPGGASEKIANSLIERYGQLSVENVVLFDRIISKKIKYMRAEYEISREEQIPITPYSLIMQELVTHFYRRDDFHENY